MQTLQFTIPASGIVQLLDPGAPNAGIQFQFMVIQNNNASGNIRVGDASVSATRGIAISPVGGQLIVDLSLAYRRSQQFWIYGAPGSIVDVLVVD